MSTAPEETAPKRATLSDQDRAAIRDGRRVLHLRHRGSALSVHRTDAGVFVTGNGHGGPDDVAGGARYESEAEASRYVHKRVASFIRSEIDSEGNGFYRSWSTGDGFVTVEHEILYTRWHVVIGDETPIVHTLQLPYDDVRAGWEFVAGTLEAAGILLEDTDLALHQRFDFGPYSDADPFGPIDKALREALAAGERILFLPHRGQCYTVHRTSVGPVVTHNGLGDYSTYAQAASFRDEARALDFAHSQVAKYIRADAGKSLGYGLRIYFMCAGHVAVEHDLHRGRWTVVVNVKTRPVAHVAEFPPDDLAAGRRFVRETIERVGLILEPDELAGRLGSDEPEPPAAPSAPEDTAAELPPHQDEQQATRGGLWALIRRMTRRRD